MAAGAPFPEAANIGGARAEHESTAGRRALVVTNIPTPYRIPLFTELARQLRDAGYQLRVVFGAAGYARRKWQIDLQDCGFEHDVLRSRAVTISGSESPSFSYPGLLALLRRERPDVIVVTGYSLATVKLWWWRLLQGTPYVIWSGAIASAHDPVAWWRRWQRRLLVRGAAACVAYGSAARNYLVSLGASPRHVHVAINTVETEFFDRETSRLERSDRPAEFLYLGDLTDRKRPDLVVQAFAIVARQRPEAVLTLVGDGPMRPALERAVAEFGIGANVRFEGFRQRAEIPRYLSRARCLVFPTQFDIWGLVLVEAMAAAVPCLASVHAGATLDLVQDGVTGFAVDFADSAATAGKMTWFIDHPAEARRIGEAARALVRERVNLPVSAAGLVAAIRDAGTAA